MPYIFGIINTFISNHAAPVITCYVTVIYSKQFVLGNPAQWTGFSRPFGYIDNHGDFTSLLNVSNKRSRPAGSFNFTESGKIFRLGLKPGGVPLWSSASSDNTDVLDHMVIWRITANSNQNLVGAYVTAREDIAGGGDRDYNDLVMLIKGDVSLTAALPPATNTVVPVPAALWLFVSGLVGLGAASRRRRAL